MRAFQSPSCWSRRYFPACWLESPNHESSQGFELFSIVSKMVQNMYCLLQNCWGLCSLEVLLGPSNWAMHQQSRVNLATCAKSVAPVNLMIAFQPLFCPFPGYSWTRFMAVLTARDGGRMKEAGVELKDGSCMIGSPSRFTSG